MKRSSKIFIALLSFVFISNFLLYYSSAIDYSKFSITSGYTVTYVLIDGMSKEIFQKELSENHLPTMKRLIEKSTYIENGIGSFPSMTGYAFYPFITGHDATESGILGLRWFDRQRINAPLRNYVGRTNVEMNQDVVDSIKTFFELAGDQYTSSINTYMNKGVAETSMTGFAHTTSKYGSHKLFALLRRLPWLGKSLIKDHFQHESNVTDIAIDQMSHNPKVQWITYPSPDAHNHVHGTDSTYYFLLRHIDKEISRLIHACDSLRQSEHRIFAIITDHGISDVSNNLDVCSAMLQSCGLNIERGKSTNLFSSKMPGSIKELTNKDGFFVINGNLSAYLYFKNNTTSSDSAWTKHLNASQLQNYNINGNVVNITNTLAKMEGIELIAYRQNDSTIIVENKFGKAFIKKKQSKYKYEIITCDVLGYGDLTRLTCQYCTKEEWVNETVDLNFPAAIPRLYEVTSKDEAGDIVICSQKGYDLAKNYEIFVGNYKGGHGGLRKELIQVPYIVFIPGKPASYKKSATSEQVGEMIGKTLFGGEE